MIKRISLLLLQLILLFCMTANAQYAKKVNTKIAWETTQQIDKFGDKTEEYILTGIAYGTFSNATVTDKPLNVYISFSPKLGVIFHIREYDKYLADLYTGWNCDLDVKTPNGEIYSFLMVPRSAGRFFPTCEAVQQESHFTKFLELLKKESYLKCFIQDSKNQAYTFKIDCRGFTKAYNEFLKANEKETIPLFTRSYLYNVQ